MPTDEIPIADVVVCNHRFVCLESPTRQTFKIDGVQVTGIEWKRRLKKSQKRVETLLARFEKAQASKSIILLRALELSLKPSEKKIYDELLRAQLLSKNIGEVAAFVLESELKIFLLAETISTLAAKEKSSL